MDQAVLATAANVSRNTIVDFEKGRRTPNPNNLAAIRTANLLAGVALDLRHPQLAMVVEGITRGGASQGSGGVAGGMTAEVAAPALPVILGGASEPIDENQNKTNKKKVDDSKG